MLVYEKYDDYLKRIIKTDKNSKLNSGTTIQYNNEEELFNIMKDGYMAMGNINLQKAYNIKNELIEIQEYETWLSGV